MKTILQKIKNNWKLLLVALGALFTAIVYFLSRRNNNKVEKLEEKIDVLQAEGGNEWLMALFIAAFATVTCFGFGVSISAKRHAAVAILEIEGVSRKGSLLAATESGVLVYWVDFDEGGARYSFVPFGAYISNFPD